MSKYGEPWSDGTNREIKTVPVLCPEGIYDRDGTPVGSISLFRIDRVLECVNAMQDLNPAGITKLLELVTKVVRAGAEAKAQGWEDHTNFIQTLEDALAACYDPGVTPNKE